MTLQQLHYFRVLAKIQHYTKASEILLISQPSLSYAISQLEKELNVPLFEKHGKKIKLSHQGERFLNYVEKSLDILDEGTKMLKTLTDPSTGTVTLGYIYSVSSKFIPEMINKFYKNDANKLVKFSLVQNVSEYLLRDLKTNKIDLIFCPKLDKSLKSVPISKQQLYLIVSKSHPFALRKDVEISELIGEPFIHLNRNSSLRDTIDDMFEQLHIKPNIVLEAEECNAVISFVSLNLGIAIVPEIPSMSNQIVTVKIRDCVLERKIYMHWTNEKYMSPTVIKTRDFIINNYTLSK
ncbi:LysR family transcriptional regulator [Sedimentibacter sp. MB31-C6]|uniref:LysR family transcriptional regulator n=1 Tax=Sedimentibacter sp. MB31-C6 TaxID=3109366 RepID=UPI002DDD24BF|nr:LysR family transcriptional regulator [Sedimentibacter sp. MB36-C1]WSI04806.1 LysR family transcriptional regulator [Sedimentibacter sp. MB36-C1]